MLATAAVMLTTVLARLQENRSSDWPRSRWAPSRLSPPFLLRPSREGGASREHPSLFLRHLPEEGAAPSSRGLEPAEPTKGDSSRVFRFRHAGEWYHGGRGLRG